MINLYNSISPCTSICKENIVHFFKDSINPPFLLQKEKIGLIASAIFTAMALIGIYFIVRHFKARKEKDLGPKFLSYQKIMELSEKRFEDDPLKDQILKNIKEVVPQQKQIEFIQIYTNQVVIDPVKARALELTHNFICSLGYDYGMQIFVAE